MEVELTMKGYSRYYRTFILKFLGPNRRKSVPQTILILLVESGLVFLGFQVSDFRIVPMCLCKVLEVLTFLTDSVLIDQCVHWSRCY